MAPRFIRIAEANTADLDALLSSELAGRMQARLGRLVDALEGEGLVAVDDGGAPVGLVTWLVGGVDSTADEGELRVLVVTSTARRRGVGGALLAAAEAGLAHAGARRAWLVTTNDNLEALAFYQRRGWRLAELHPGTVDEARRTLKPSIGEIADNGIPIRDELMLTRDI